MRILLVEDHRTLAATISAALAKGGFAVDHAATGQQARELASLAEYSLILLDCGLPDEDGLKLLPILRQGGRVPVIVLTARDQLADRLAGLDGGADDYVVKPVEMPELVARCRAVLRRPGDRSSPTLQHGDLRLDRVDRTASVANRLVPLGSRDIGVLEILMQRAGRVAPRATIEQAIYGLDDEVTPNALEASISRLRRALETAGYTIPIVTIRGVGWMLPQEDEA